MNIKTMMDRALFALSVPKCVGCGERLKYGENTFCPKCSAEFYEFCHRECSRCAKVLNRCNCSNHFLETHFVRRVVKCYRYLNRDDHPGNKLIFSLKRDNRKDVLERSSDLLFDALNNSFTNLSEYVFTNIPRRKAAIVEYGIDHSALLAKEIARKSGAEYIQLLSSKAKKPQKSLESIERRKNADFEIIRDIDLGGKKIIIVDDIITSGASMANAALLIRSLGCRDITAACLAIAYKDD